MYDINLRNVKKGRTIWLIFLGAGLFFAAIMLGIGLTGIVKKNSMDAQTQATRIEVREHYDSDSGTLYSPVYYYEVDGREYSCSSNSSSSIYPSQTQKTVYYDSKNPQNCVTEYSSSSNYVVFFFLIIPLIFIVLGVVNMLKISKRIKIIKELNQTGKLVKNLPYYLENTGVVVNGVPIRRPVVNYTLPTGGTVLLRGDARNDGRLFDADGLVDILIDENNPENYYIDLEINRLSGNLDSDYYMGNRNPQPQIPGQNMMNNPYGNPYGQPPMNNPYNSGDSFYVDYGNKQ